MKAIGWVPPLLKVITHSIPKRWQCLLQSHVGRPLKTDSWDSWLGRDYLLCTFASNHEGLYRSSSTYWTVLRNARSVQIHSGVWHGHNYGTSQQPCSCILYQMMFPNTLQRQTHEEAHLVSPQHGQSRPVLPEQGSRCTSCVLSWFKAFWTTPINCPSIFKARSRNTPRLQTWSFKGSVTLVQIKLTAQFLVCRFPHQ